MSLFDLPRERLFCFGPRALSIQELISVILMTGNKTKHVSMLAADIALALEKGDVTSLEGRLRPVSGLGDSAIAQILAALELGRRYASARSPREKRIQSPKDVCRYVKPHMAHLPDEHFFVLLLDTKNRPIQLRKIAQGQKESVQVSVRDLFHVAIQFQSSAFVCIHNHPSGDPLPSKEDEKLTYKIKSAASALGVRYLDHIIFSDQKAFSFTENQVIDWSL